MRVSENTFSDYREDDDDEIFTLDDYRFNITDLLRRIERKEISRVDEFAKIDVWQGYVAVFGIPIDDEYAQKITPERLAIPVIFATLPTGAQILIDGNHRMAKARAVGLRYLRAWYLDRETTGRLLEVYTDPSRIL